MVRDRNGGRGEGSNGEKCKGRPRKPLAEVFSLERPVARHFVCRKAKHPRCHLQVAENNEAKNPWSGRNCQFGRKIYVGYQYGHEACRTPVEIL
jgi:hypothetical protein